jgi:hypothetical protein
MVSKHLSVSSTNKQTKRLDFTKFVTNIIPKLASYSFYISISYRPQY